MDSDKFQFYKTPEEVVEALYQHSDEKRDRWHAVLSENGWGKMDSRVRRTKVGSATIHAKYSDDGSTKLIFFDADNDPITNVDFDSVDTALEFFYQVQRGLTKLYAVETVEEQVDIPPRPWWQKFGLR